MGVPKVGGWEVSGCPQSGRVGSEWVLICFLSDFKLYQIEVVRTDPQLEPSTIFRRYSEFDELQTKLASSFPNVTLPNLPGKIYMPGKSNSREVRVF